MHNLYFSTNMNIKYCHIITGSNEDSFPYISPLIFRVGLYISIDKISPNKILHADSFQSKLTVRIGTIRSTQNKMPFYLILEQLVTYKVS